MYFNRMKSFYENESNGKYSIDGTVTEWVKVPFNEARYGRDLCGGVACNNTWFLVRDGLAYWVETKMADDGDNWPLWKVRRYLKTFDELDRYDFDGDGDFKEPDGYIDHFQIVHAGQDGADGDPIYNDDAIWSHRWNAQIHAVGTGPGRRWVPGPDHGVHRWRRGRRGWLRPDGGAVNVPDNPTGVWVNDYTIQPENGGLSVFAHEFAHDLDLPDLYDTSGNTGGAENSVGFWSLMSQSRGTLPQGRRDRRPADADGCLGQVPARLARLRLVPDRRQRARPRSVPRSRPTPRPRPRPRSCCCPTRWCTLGTRSAVRRPAVTSYFYSDEGNDLDNTMTVEVADGGALTAKVHYEIEAEYDYAFLEASSDGGDTWTGVDTNLPTVETLRR